MAMSFRLGAAIATVCALSLAGATRSTFAQDNDKQKAQPRTQSAPPAREAPRRESAPPREAGSARESAPVRERAVARESAPPRETRESAPRSEPSASRRASEPRETSVDTARARTRVESGATSANEAALEEQAVRRNGSRPRDGRVTTARAVPRDPRDSRPRQTIIYYPRRDYPFGYGGYGLGYFYYDPYAWGYYPGYYGGYGYGYPSYGGGVYSGGYGYGYAAGAIRLKVKPRQAEVYVDGYYVGRVDDFDGVFQRLTLEAGPHRIEIREPGLDSLAFDIRIRPGETITYDGDLRKLP